MTDRQPDPRAASLLGAVARVVGRLAKFLLAPRFKIRIAHMKRISILGSTGSIGRQCLNVVESHPDRFEVVALAAGSQRGN